MTSKFTNSKSKLILVLLMVSILCLSLFSVSCKKDETKKDVPSFSYTQTDDGLISNPTFSYGTLDTELKNFPKTSITGWTRSKDSNSNITQSSAKSGAINVTEDGYEELLNALYKDTYIRRFVERENDISETDVKTAIKNAKGDENYKPSSDEIKEYYIENYIKTLFPNPSTHTGSEDNVVYMLNNYRTSTYLGIGTSQKITSSSEVTLNKGEYGKVTVWVKTQNITAANEDFGANIRIINKFNGTEQAEYAVTKIDTNGEWKEYTVYVKADDYFDTSIKIALGLGYDLDGITQGTVYFDDVTFTHLDKLPDELNDTNSIVSNFDYNNDDKIIVPVSTKTPILNLSFAEYLEDNANGFFKDAACAVTDSATTSNTGKTGLPFANSSIEKDVYTFAADEVRPFEGAVANKITLANASATVKYTSNAFVVPCEEYVYVAFYIKNQLNKFGSQSITFDVVEDYNETPDKLDDDTVTAAVASITEASDEWQKVDLVIKNNFAKDKGYKERTFSINVVIGPADVVTAKYAYEFATGEVFISNPIIASGTMIEDDASEVEYDLYSLLSSSAKASTALYAGYSSDYTDSSDTETYALTTAPSDIGAILNTPASVKGYQGVIADHTYIKENGSTAKIDARKKADADGNIAGLINTKYLTSYDIDGLETALDFTATDDEKAIQPIMIYNATKNHYGYIGESKSISASSYAKVSVTLKVVGDAKAYIYLVDTSAETKNVLTFTTPDDKVKELSLVIPSTENMKDNGWLTVEFYVATGATAKNFRVEMWNGSRDGNAETASQGFVFIKNVSVTTSSAFTEPSTKTDINTDANPIGAQVKDNGSDINKAFAELITYERELTETEKAFNKEYSSDKDVTKINYKENFIWAKNDAMIYAVYNTIDPVEVNPYDSIPEDEDVSEGCTAETDPSTFWLSFSSILLGVALVVAIVMLFIKNIRRRRKANASDAKSHYTITSRTKAKKDATKAKKVEVAAEPAEEVKEENTETEEIVEKVSEEPATEENEEQVEETEEPRELSQEEKDKQILDSYVYGDVQIFGDEKEEKND